MQFVHGQHIGRGERRGARTPFIIQRRVQCVSFSRAMLLSLGCSYSSGCVCVCVCVHQSETASLSRDNEILREELRQLRPGDVDRSEAIPASTLIDIINQRVRLSMKVTAIDCSRFAGPIVCGLPPTCNLFLEQDIVLDSVCQVDLFDSIDERDKEHTIQMLSIGYICQLRRMLFTYSWTNSQRSVQPSTSPDHRLRTARRLVPSVRGICAYVLYCLS